MRGVNIMKVLLINGSPHEKGCTYTALQEIIDTLTAEGIESELLWLGNKPILGCIGCGYCYEHKKCFKDDMVNEVAEKAKEIDGFIFGTAVHYAAVSGALTSFMDRLFYSGKRGLFMKPAAGVVSCRRSGSTATYDQINKYFGITQMPIVSSQYWNAVHGNTPDEVRQDMEGMQTMRVIGRNMAWLLKSIEAGRAAGVPLPMVEKKQSTNFIR